MKHSFLIIVILALLYSCSNHSDDYYIDEENYKDLKVSKDNIPDINVSYFPSKLLFYENAKLSSFDTNSISYYSMVLYNLHEPLLLNKHEHRIIYRFLWDRSFSQPIVICIEKSNGEYQLYWKLLSLNQTKVEFQQTKTISKSEWNQFLELINRYEFWNQKPRFSFEMCLDGESWIIEGKDKKYYNIVGTNESSESLTNLTDYVKNLAKMDSTKINQIEYPDTFFKYHKDTGQVNDFVEVQPVFQNGNDDLIKYLQKNIDYTKLARERRIQGSVYISMVIDENGQIMDVSVLKSINADLDSICVAKIKIMPRWKPGKIHGKNVKTKVVLPVKFVLNE